MRTQETHALLGYVSELQQGNHLESTAVRKNVVWPRLKLVRPTNGIQHRLAGFEAT